jgi:hypothetical protein
MGQHPGGDGGDTPGVAVAPVALASVIMAGFARFIVMPSLHAAEFGAGTTVRFGSMLVPPSSVIAGRIAPAGVPIDISGVESGNAAPLVGGPPGMKLHTVFDELPSEDTGDMVPVVLPRIGMVPNGIVGVDPVVPPIADTVGVAGAICPVGVAQVTAVPGVVGSEANGTGASVVSGVPGRVAAENGLGPLSGDVKIAPGVVGSPKAVVPMVETCAMLTLQANSRAAAVNS